MKPTEQLILHTRAEVISDVREAFEAASALHEYYESLCILRLDSNTLSPAHLQNKTALLNIIRELEGMLRR